MTLFRRRPTHASTPRKNRVRLRLHALEDRLAPAVLDLTAPNSSGQVNGALFLQDDPPGSTGTGTLNSFVQIQNQGSESGYNTTGTTEFDTAGAEAVLLSSLPTVTVGGVDYVELLVDINEPGASNLLSLQQIQVFLGETGDLTGYPTFNNQAVEVFNLDVGPDGDSRVDLDASLAPGSGDGDLVVLIPAARFSISPNPFVYVFSTFGTQDGAGFSSDGGFEEWAFSTAGAVTPLADLSLTKAVSDPAPIVGDQVTFTIAVTNGGPATATNVAVADALPAGLGFVSATPSQGSYSSGTGIWTVGTLAPAASATLTITATVAALGTLTNTAQVSTSDQFDPDSTPNNNVPTEDDQAQVTVTPRPAPTADLSLTKTVNNATPGVGQQVTFTVTLTNAGPDAATGVSVTDQLPAGLAFVSAIPSQGTYTGATGVWAVGSLAAGATATLAITATVTSATTATNTAQVSASDQFDPDSTPNNGVPTEDDQASATIVSQALPAADLRVTKVASPRQVVVGQRVTFTIVVRNVGPDPATNVLLADPLPAGLRFISATVTQGLYSSAAGLWAIGSLAPGATATLRIVAQVVAAGRIRNTATVSAPVFDPNPANNTSTDVITARVPAISKRLLLMSNFR